MKTIDRGLWLILGLYLLIIVILSNFSFFNIPLYDEKRVLGTAVLILTSLLFLPFFLKHKIEVGGNKVKVLLGVLLFLMCLSSIGASLSVWAFLELGWYILLVQFTFLCIYLYQQNKQMYIQWLIGALFLLAGVYIVHVLANTFSSFLQEGWPTWPKTANFSMLVDGKEMVPQGFLGFSNKRFFNHLQTWSLPLLVFGVTYYRDQLIPGFRYLFLAVVSGWVMLVFAAEARGTILSSLISVAVIAYLYRGEAKKFIVTYGSAALTGFLVYLVFFWAPALLEPHGRGIISRYSDHFQRLELWYISLKNLISYPFLGLGPMHFSHLSVNAPAAHPHNFILQNAVEWGIPAVFIFMALSIIGYLKFIRQKISAKYEKASIIHIALVTSLTAGTVHSMVSGIFNTPFSQLLFCIILGWAIGHYFEQEGSVPFVRRKNIKWSTWVIAFLLVSNIVFVAQKVVCDVSTMEERNELYIKNAPRDDNGKVHLQPRFWQQGKIGLEE